MKKFEDDEKNWFRRPVLTRPHPNLPNPDSYRGRDRLSPMERDEIYNSSPLQRNTHQTNNYIISQCFQG